MVKRQLVLEDGTFFIGEGFGSERGKSGEIIFHTGMTGYQEIITDPSNYGQIITMTYPIIGNYGINRDDFETITPFIHGLVVKEVNASPSNFRSEENLDQFLKANDIPGISGIDTRKLTRLIRNKGTMRAMITNLDQSIEEVLEELKHTEGETQQVRQTSTTKPYVVPGRGQRIVMVDFGVKHSILRELTKRDCHITVVPYNYQAENILRLKPDGMMLTNGPGNPKDIPEAIEMIKEVIGKVPILGVGLGHQLFALANGADTEKLKVGHHGTSHPVKDLERNKTYLTSQNHGFTVKTSSIQDTDLELTQVSLNDQTVEGIRHKKYPAFSVQYHPEASPGPDDTNFLFDKFIQNMKENHSKKEVEVDA